MLAALPVQQLRTVFVADGVSMIEQVIGAVVGKALVAEWLHRRFKRKELLRGTLGSGGSKQPAEMGALKQLPPSRVERLTVRRD